MTILTTKMTRMVALLTVSEYHCKKIEISYVHLSLVFHSGFSYRFAPLKSLVRGRVYLVLGLGMEVLGRAAGRAGSVCKVFFCYIHILFGVGGQL
jgi:hypothetical protein